MNVAFTNAEKTEILNNFFENVFDPKSEETLAHSIFANRKLNKYQISEADTFKIMEKLEVNKAKRPDSIVNSFLKRIAPTLCKSLHLLFTTFINKGNLPNM